MIKAKDVVFEYQKYDEEGNVCETKRAVDGVELDVKKGDFVAILGHNGSGKSTLAKHINALLLPNEGEVWVAGMNTKDETMFGTFVRMQGWYSRIRITRSLGLW